MSRDLTDALRVMMDSPPVNIVPALKPRGIAAEVKSSANLPGGQSGDAPAGEFIADGTKTITSTDGLFTFYYPETLKTTIDGVSYTVGVVTKTP